MKLYNTLTRDKQEFIPIVDGEVRIYICGPTVYNYFHIGNARPFITFDTLRRYFEYKKYRVIYVQNFTDIDDKMIAQANKEGISVRELADRFISEYYHDADKLNIKRASFQPRATDCIDEMIDIISILEKKGYAYATDDGVYFNVKQYAQYGRLSRYNLDELEAGANDRVNINESKKDAADFALWKFKKEGEPSWDSPWGEGRPGWHIECSAMARKYLGDTIDIHCGGKDLIFPHHENEIAQSEAATGQTYVRYWLHNGFINLNNQKMSKSTGCFFTIRDICERYAYDNVRFFILSSHYRSPINFSDDLLEAAGFALERIRNCVESLLFVTENRKKANIAPSVEKVDFDLDLDKAINKAKIEFMAAMDDDLNTSDALAAVFELVREANIAIVKGNVLSSLLLQARSAMIELCDILGIIVIKKDAIPEQILNLVEKRVKAKKEKNYSQADEIRKQIEALGYSVSDTSDGPKITKL
ncbi:MAG: cysteine--tRNA ligase [Saccharofermentanales bacterium]